MKTKFCQKQKVESLKKIDLRHPNTRRQISAETVAWRKIAHFERENDWKYIIEPYEKSGLANMAYFHQHITKTTLAADLLPDNFKKPSSEKIEKMAKLVPLLREQFFATSKVAGSRHSNSTTDQETSRRHALAMGRGQLSHALFKVFC